MYVGWAQIEGKDNNIFIQRAMLNRSFWDFLFFYIYIERFWVEFDVGRYNTIATWQSLNVLEKKAKNEHNRFLRRINFSFQITVRIRIILSLAFLKIIIVLKIEMI